MADKQFPVIALLKTCGSYFRLVSTEPIRDERIEIVSITRRCPYISTICFFETSRLSTRIYTNEQIRRTSHSRTRRCHFENLGHRRNTSEVLDLIESLIKCTPAPITGPFYDSRFGKLSEIVPD